MSLGRGIRYTVYLSRGVDKLFYCWSRVLSTVKGFEEEFKVCNPEDFWVYTSREKRYAEFLSKYVKPRKHITISLRSKELFSWGIFELFTKLPRFSKGPILWFGFELEDLFGGGVIHFAWSTDEGVLKAFAGGFSSRVEMDLTQYLPEDVSEKKHLYKVVYRRGLALWYIDDRLRALAIVVSGDRRDSKILYRGKSYTIGFTRDTPSPSLPALLSIDGGDIEKDYEWDVHPWDLRVSHGDPETPVMLDLYRYDEDEKLEELRISNEIISAPIPGTTKHKEIMFATKGSGKLCIETLVNSEWYTYKEFEVEDKKLYNITLSNTNILYRILFTPRGETRILKAKIILA